MTREPTVLTEAVSGSIGEMSRTLLARGHDVVTDGNLVLFLREDDAEALLTDPRFNAVAMAVLDLSGVTAGPLYDLWSNLMFGKDGDEHHRIRATVAKRFTSAAVQPMAAVAAGIAAELTSAWGDGDVVDLWPAYSFPLVARTTCSMLGIPDEDALQAGEWALALVQAFGVLDEQARARAEQAAVEVTAYLDGLLEARRAEPADDMASLVLSHIGDDLTYEEGRALVANLLFGGLEAMTKSLLNSTFHLLELGMWSQLADDPDRAAHAVDELLRYHPPAGAVFRLAGEDLDVRGVAVGAGQLAMPNLWAACRDARRYADPDALVLDRPSGKPFPFGAGSHFCLGAHLARVVLGEGMRALARRAPNLSLAVDPAELEWSQDPFDGLLGLPVRIA